MSERYFGFESITSMDENGLTKIEFSTDSRSEMRFEAIHTHFESLRSPLLFVDYFTMLKSAGYQVSKIAYRDWYANEIIRRISEDKSYYDEQPDAKKEVLKELVVRRNKLMKQLERAMTFYNDNKERIDQVEKIRANFQKSFPGPLLINNREYLIFENLTEYGDIFFQIGVKIDYESHRENIAGAGWLEYSKYFSENITGLRFTASGVHLSNTKPRSDIRVLRRGDSRPFRVFSQNMDYRQAFIDSGLLNYFDKNDQIRKFGIKRPDLFVIISMCRKHYDDNQNITLQISTQPDTEFNAFVSANVLHIYLSSDSVDHFEFNANASTFIGLQHLVHLISEVKIEIYPQNFGYGVSFRYSGGQGRVINNSHISKSEKFHRKLLSDYLQESGTFDIQALLGNQGFLGDIEYGRQTNYLPKQQSSRQNKMDLLLSLKRDSFTINQGEVQYSEKDTIARVTTGGKINLSCTCGKMHKTYLCEHSAACLILGYLEGILNA